MLWIGLTLRAAIEEDECVSRGAARAPQPSCSDLESWTKRLAAPEQIRRLDDQADAGRGRPQSTQAPVWSPEA